MHNKIVFEEYKPTIVVFSLYPETHACPVIRIIDPLVVNNYKVLWGAKYIQSKWSFDLEAAYTADLIIIQRHFPSAHTVELLEKILKSNVPIAYELDDMLIGLPSFHPSYENLNYHKPYIKWILKAADMVIASTPNLQISLKKYTTRPIHVQTNLVNWDLFNSSPRPISPPFTFLVSGTSTHTTDWSIIEESLLKILSNYPDKVKAIFFGNLPEKFLNHPAVQLIKFEDGYKKYADKLKKINVNCALVPLEDTHFNNCKSNIKWLEYSAAGIAGIYSNITPYNSSIRHGETGFLVKNTADAWFQAMNQLIKNPGTALEMVENARVEVRNNYSVESSSADYNKFIHSLVGQPHQRNFFSKLSILPTRMKENTKTRLTAFLNKHILWRFTPQK